MLDSLGYRQVCRQGNHSCVLVSVNVASSEVSRRGTGGGGGGETLIVAGNQPQLDSSGDKKRAVTRNEQ